MGVEFIECYRIVDSDNREYCCDLPSWEHCRK